MPFRMTRLTQFVGATMDVHLVVEAVLEANPHLSEFGPFLPMGTKVQLPELQTQQNKTQSIQLWD